MKTLFELGAPLETYEDEPKISFPSCGSQCTLFFPNHEIRTSPELLFDGDTKCKCKLKEFFNVLNGFQGVDGFRLRHKINSTLDVSTLIFPTN